jgi:lipoprotein-releasing system ATP-binding protein
MHYHPNRLSGGELQRTAVVRALINRPEILLADDPTGSLDHASAESLSDLLVELNREEGTSLVLVTHWGGLARKMGRVLGLTDGTLRPSEEIE